MIQKGGDGIGKEEGVGAAVQGGGMQKMLEGEAGVEVPYGSHIAIGPSGHSVTPAILIT
jgi:hypothetical protein